MTDINPRREFFSLQDWHDHLPELLSTGENAGAQLRELRKAVYREIETIRDRPLLVYATRFPGVHPAAPISIDQGDIDGFSDLVSSVPESQTSVDVLLHSPGGSPEATERIVYVLRSRFKSVSFLVPHTAYSAATMLALSGDEILLHPSATLGPIDPQINGIPARSIRRGFDRVRELLKNEGPEALPAYLPLLEKYSLQTLELCDDSLKLSKELVQEWLSRYMFHGDSGKQEIVAAAVQFFSDYDEHKTHSRPLMLDKLGLLNLNIKAAEPPLRKLIREAYILLIGFFGISRFVKVFENSGSLSWGKQFDINSDSRDSGGFSG